MRLFLAALLFSTTLSAQVFQLGDAPQRPLSKAVPTGVTAADVLGAPSGINPAASLPSVNVHDRESVRQFHLAAYVTAPAIGWTGSLVSGEPGTTSQAFRDAVLQRVNYYRALAGVPATVTFDNAFNQQAQSAALMMAANGQLSHTPTSDWKFYTAEGAAAAGKSNLALGLYGTGAIDGYMVDPGSNNAAAGHRRWILYPQITRMGTGDIPAVASPQSYASNALVVVSGIDYSAARVARDGYVAWPYPGYLPSTLLPTRFSVSHPNGNFANSTVTATFNGVPLTVTVEDRNDYYGEGPALVFNLARNGTTLSASTLTAQDLDKTISIKIANTLINGSVQEIDYDVVPFDVTVAKTSSVPQLQLPSQLTATVGQAFSYSIVATGATSFSASGLPGGLGLNSGTGVISGTPTAAGTFTLSITATNTAGSSAGTVSLAVAAASSSPSSTNGSRFVNVSTRSRIGTGENVMIAGFIIGGTESKTVLIRGIGPGLKQFGLSDAAGEVILELHDSQKLLASNQGWSTSTDAAQIASTTATVGAFALTPGSGDSVILKTLPAGGYTALLSTPAGKEGIGLVEAYEVGTSGSRFINISTRAVAGPDSATMIVGFIVQGTGPRKVLIRAVGRSLSAFGISSPIAQPTLQLVSGSTTLLTAGAWAKASNATEISAATAASGAFALDPANNDSAFVATLDPGGYTALVSAAPGTANGVCLLEAYEAP